MPLNPEIEMLLNQMSALPSLETLGPQAARGLLAELGKAATAGPDVLSVSDDQVDCGQHVVPLRIYRDTDEPSGILIYYHGGGWVLGSLDSVDPLMRWLARETQCCVVSVDYRLAPEHPFPAAVEDAGAVLAWVDDRRASLASGSAQIVVAGDSAGANLATVTAIVSRDSAGPKIAAQLLFYPTTDCAMDTISYQDYAEGYYLTRNMMAWFWDQYVAGPAQRSDFRASPLRCDDLANLPPALVMTAEFDPLRDEGEAYAERLTAAGVSTSIDRRAGLIHGFIGMRHIEAASQAVADAANWLSRQFEARGR